MSAKGTTWSNHKYIKVEDGKYYYPDSYEGGRHNANADPNAPTVESREPTGWDTKLFASFEDSLRLENGKLDPQAVQNMLLFGKDESGKAYDNFKVALGKAGIDTSQIDEQSLNLMRYKVVEHYKNEFAKEKAADAAEAPVSQTAKTSKSVKKKKATASVKTTETPKKTEVKTPESSIAKNKVKYAYKANGKIKKEIKHGLIQIPKYEIKPTKLKWNIL